MTCLEGLTSQSPITRDESETTDSTRKLLKNEINLWMRGDRITFDPMAETWMKICFHHFSLAAIHGITWMERLFLCSANTDAEILIIRVSSCCASCADLTCALFNLVRHYFARCPTTFNPFAVVYRAVFLVVVIVVGSASTNMRVWV